MPRFEDFRTQKNHDCNLMLAELISSVAGIFAFMYSKLCSILFLSSFPYNAEIKCVFSWSLANNNFGLFLEAHK